TSLSAPWAKLVCDAYGIAVAKQRLATSAQEAVRLAGEIGYPVAMKVVSPDILHKTEAGGVITAVADADAAARAYAAIVQNAKAYKARAVVEGVEVQEMVGGGPEVVVGALSDPTFGKLVAFGLGGILVEILRDVTFRLAPVTHEEALSMVGAIRAAQILDGVRGGGAADRKVLGALIQNVSRLVSDFPEIAEIDLNPVFARSDGAIAADVRIVLDFAPPKARYRPSREEILRAMNRIMKPDSVAVIGASPEDGKIGNSVMKNLVDGGYRGAIYPINPRAGEVLGLRAYRSVTEVPGDIDIAVFAIPAPLVAGALAQCGEKKVAGAILIPSGFAETGNVALQDQVVEVARRVSKTKPVIMLKAGRTALGARAARSHTAALAGNDKVYDDVLRQSGVVRARGLDEMLEFARCVPIMPAPRGENVVIITGAGGSGVLLADACVDNGLELMTMPPDLDAAFRKFIPPFGAAGNPVDITGGEPPSTYRSTIRLGLEDPRVHALILGYWHTGITPPMVFAKLLGEVVEEYRLKGIEKPIVASLVGDVEVEQACAYLFERRIPAYPYTTERPVTVLGAKYAWARAAGLPGLHREGRRVPSKSPLSTNWGAARNFSKKA